MNTSDDDIRDAIAEQAAEWLIANLSGSLDDLGRQNFLAWLRSSPIHVAEYLSIAVIDSDLTAATAELEESVETLVAGARQEAARPAPNATTTAAAWLRQRLRPALGPRFVFRAVVAAIILGVAAGSVWMWADGFRRSVYYSTAHGAQQLLRLRDGSEVRLDTDSALTVRLSRHERLVELSRGQAYFRVAHDSRRFRVTVAGASVVAVGTEFDVDQRGQSAFVTLVDGKLAVVAAGVAIPEPGIPLSGAAILNKGEQARITMGSGIAIEPAVNLPSVTAWLEHQIVADNRPLEEVAAEFNRYGKTPIEIGDANVGQLRISGTFNVDDTESFLAFLEQMDGLTVARSPEVIRVAQRRPVGR